jgi:hypothetical protein
MEVVQGSVTAMTAGLLRQCRAAMVAASPQAGYGQDTEQAHLHTEASAATAIVVRLCPTQSL